MALAETPYEFWPSQVDKIIQMHHTLKARNGLMIIGPAGGGKTVARQILQQALVFLPVVRHKEQNDKHIEDFDEKSSSKNTSHLVRVCYVLVFTVCLL